MTVMTAKELGLSASHLKAVAEHGYGFQPNQANGNGLQIDEEATHHHPGLPVGASVRRSGRATATEANEKLTATSGPRPSKV